MTTRRKFIRNGGALLIGFGGIGPLDSGPGKGRGNGSDNRPDHAGPPEDKGEEANPQEVGDTYGYFFPAGMSAADAPVAPLTDVCFHALDIGADGTPIVTNGEDMATLADRAHAAGTTPHLQVGGMEVDFGPAVEHPDAFAAGAVDVMEEYGYRGIAVDWEYPEDGSAFAALMGALREELDARGGGFLGGAVSALPYIADEAYAVEEVGPLVEYLVIMSYDFAGPWSDTTGHNSATFSTEAEPNSVASATAYWQGHPIDAEKLRAGVPFYGRSFTGVGPANDGYDQPFEDGGAHGYGQVTGMLEDGDFERFVDDDAGVPYAYSATEETFLSYESPASVQAKVELAGKEVGGVGVWAINQDPARELIEGL